MGFGTPKFWITESGWDSLPDMGAQGILDHFRDRYGIPAPHKSIRGVNTLRPIFEDYFPQWTWQRAAFEQLKWLASIYPDNYVGLNLFTISNAPDWKGDAGTDYSELYDLHNLLLAAKESPVPTTETYSMPPDESPLWLRAILKPVGSVANIRREPKKADDNIINTLEGSRTGYIAPDYQVKQPDGVWYPISLTEGDGWARGDVFTFTLITTPPPVDPIPDPVDTDAVREYMFHLRPSQLQTLKDLLAQIA